MSAMLASSSRESGLMPAHQKKPANLPARSTQLQRKSSCACGGGCPRCKADSESDDTAKLQKKLSIGASNDPLEQEADRVADQVLAEPIDTQVNHSPPRIQRFTANATEASNYSAPASVDRVLAGSGSPLEASIQNDMGQRFGNDFSDVRVHSGTAAEQSARDVNANAYTVGRNIVFGTNQFSPTTNQGKRLLAHELTHVVQQRACNGKDGGHSNRLDREPSDEQTYMLPVPTMNAKAEREFDKGDHIGKVRYSIDAPNTTAALPVVFRILNGLSDADLRATLAALSDAQRKKLEENIEYAVDLNISRLKEAIESSVSVFATRKYKLSSNEITVVPGSEAKGITEIKESPEFYAGKILAKAGLDPDVWFSNFTSISFLGRTVTDIHTDLAAHLKTVEKNLAATHGGDQKDPIEAGKKLGLDEDIGGARHTPTAAVFSMHLFGLAIDVNYTTNPWVGANVAFEHGGALVQGRKMNFKDGMSYADLSALDQTMETYFSYLDNSAALGKQLELNSQGPANFWTGKSAEDAQKQIQQDLDFCASKWQRIGAKEKIKKGGFLSLPEAFVNAIDLDWGASYGDIMHFDMRNKGNGRKIQSAIGQYKAEKKAESEKKD